MEKLPIHSKEYGDTLNSTDKSQTNPSLKTYLWRAGIVGLFLTGYYLLLLSPASLQCSGMAPQSENYEAGISEENHGHPILGIFASDVSQSSEQTRIPLEAHIMSKCPDAQACLQKLVLPAMERVSEKVDFKLSFIASVSKDTEEIECKHGPGECIGDMLMLCAANLPFPPPAEETLLPPQYPRTPIIRSLGFSNCLLNDFARIPDREFVHQCAMEHGIDFDALNKCASQQNDDPGDGKDGEPPLSGIALLRKSAMHGEQLGVTTSCTVRLDDAVWCIRDGDEWKDCAQNGQGSQSSVLVDQVEKLWNERN